MEHTAWRVERSHYGCGLALSACRLYVTQLSQAIGVSSPERPALTLVSSFTAGYGRVRSSRLKQAGRSA
jgi:hypothetical protein